MQHDGNCEVDVKRRMFAGWNSRKKVMGKLCVRNVPDKRKGKCIRHKKDQLIFIFG